MIAHRFLSAAFIVGLFAPHSAFAMDWEIERNFRYFLYPSDIAAQRVARGTAGVDVKRSVQAPRVNDEGKLCARSCC
jgi:hypothetical protein